MVRTGPIVLGLDGSTNVGPALDWAALEASRRRLPLELLHARSDLPRTMMGDPAFVLPAQRSAPASEDDPPCFLDLTRRIKDRWPDVDVLTRVVQVGAPYALVMASSGASMVVVGAHGRSIVGRILLGSVGHHLAAHASCPAVVVKRSPGDEALPVLVGVDVGPAWREALRVAADEAVQRHVALVAVHTDPKALGGGHSPRPSPRRQTDESTTSTEQQIVDALDDAVHERPELEIRERFLRADPADALLAEAEHCQLLVVGSRGRSGWSAVLIGSIASEMVQHADCPTVVVPPQVGRRSA